MCKSLEVWETVKYRAEEKRAGLGVGGRESPQEAGSYLLWPWGHQVTLHTCHHAVQLLPLHNLTSTANLRGRRHLTFVPFHRRGS